MFNKKSKKTSINPTINELQKIIEELNREKELSKLRQEFTDKEKERLLKEKDLKISELKEESEAKTATVVKENNLDLQQERNTYKARCEILEKAFENLGFDVKDMKDILNKLVDGLIAKNEIKILK